MFFFYSDGLFLLLDSTIRFFFHNIDKEVEVKCSEKLPILSIAYLFTVQRLTRMTKKKKTRQKKVMRTLLMIHDFSEKKVPVPEK